MKLFRDVRRVYRRHIFDGFLFIDLHVVAIGVFATRDGKTRPPRYFDRGRHCKCIPTFC